MLTGMRRPAYFPEHLCFDKVENVVKVLEQTRTNLSETLRPRLVREHDLLRFVKRSEAAAKRELIESDAEVQTKG
jgi:hypothetical protein